MNDPELIGLIESENIVIIGEITATGEKGDPGKSAYEIWIEEGNSGTEADFLASLEGTDTVTSINGKTGIIEKADIVALGIPAQDTVYSLPESLPYSMLTDTPTIPDISGKADKTYVDNKVKTDVPAGAVFTDTIVDISGKQDKLTAGTNVSIAGNTISAVDTNTVTSINGKTGIIEKADIVALGIPAQDTVYSLPESLPYSMLTDTPTIPDISGKADKTYVDNKVKTDVPAGAVFTDTIVDISGKQDKLTAGTNVSIAGNTISAVDTNTVTSINGKTGIIEKADIVALGIPAQDTVVDISGKADTTYVDGKVKTDVPVGAKFTDTVYTHPATHSADMITGLPASLPASGGNADTVGGFTVGTNVPADAVFTDTKTTINGKTGTIAKADIVALGIPAQDTVYTHPPGTNPHGTTKSDVGLSNVTNDKQMPISGGILENYTEKLVTLSGTSTTINLNNGNVFTHTLSGDTVYSISNAQSQAHSFTLIITQTETVRTITFPASVKWQGGEIPDMTTASKTYVLTFLSIDGGTTWLGMFGGEF